MSEQETQDVEVSNVEVEGTEKELQPEVLVQFTERPGIRLIRAEDWEAAGVKDHADTRWGPENDWTVKRSDIGVNDEQFARIIVADRYFRVTAGS